MLQRIYLLVGILLLNICGFLAVFSFTNSNISYAQGTIITPTFNYLAPCPSCSSPSVNPVSSAAVYPTGNQPAPTGGIYNPAPTTLAPCDTNDNAMTDHKSRHKKHHGAISKLVEQILNFFLELIKMLIELLGGSIATPSTPQPAPNPQDPLPSPAAPQPCVPSQAPISQPMPQPSAATPSAPAPSQPQPSGTMTFSDDFDGTTLDTSKWEIVDSNKTSGGYSLGGSCFVDDGQHVLINNGTLILRATQAPSPMECNGGMWNPKNYLSGFVWTRNKFSQTYGKFEVRAKLPDGKGAWPAFWMWAQEGRYNNAWTEIDIFEAYDYGSYTDIGATLHEVGGGDTQWCNMPSVSNDFHVYTMEWSANNISIYYDNKLCKKFTDWTASGLTNPQPFDQPMYMLLNLAVGMNFGPNGASQTIPDSTNTWPMDMVVDYVRVWK